MKHIFKLLLLAFAVISLITESDCSRPPRKFRLSHVFKNINEKQAKIHRNELENEIIKVMDMDCVKNFFNLPGNNKLLVTQIEELIFKIAASMKCSNEEKVFARLLDELIFRGLSRRLDCLKWILQNYEPDSKLVENFQINQNETKECSNKFSSDGIKMLQEEFEGTLGPLSVYSCGSVTGSDDYMKFVAKGAIILYGNISQELKEAELKKMMEHFKDIAVTTVNCNLRRFEDDPRAYSINDTLNHYFIKYIVHLDFQQTQDISNDTLASIEAAIDHDCVKEKLNLPENGHKSLLKIKSTVLLTLAKSKCIKGDLIKFSELFFDFLVPEYIMSEDNLICAKLKLQELEPASKLVETFTSSKSDCSDHDLFHPFDIYQWDYEKTVGPLNETTCGLLTDEAVHVVGLKTYLLANEMDEELKNEEIQALFASVTE